MFTMEEFHQILFSNENQEGSYLAKLVELTRSNLEQIRNLKSGSEWEVWRAETDDTA